MAAYPIPGRLRAPAPRDAPGFTLIELLVVIAIVAVLSAMAMPNFDAVMLRSAVRSASSGLGADLNMARAEAVRIGARVSVCPRSGPTDQTCGSDWTRGWLVFREGGSTGIGSFGGTDRLLREHGPIHASLTLSRTLGSGALTFNASGALQPSGGPSTARLELRGPKVPGRNLDISVIGRLTTAETPITP